MHITSNNTELCYAECGAGKPLLAVHGFPLSGRLWAQITPMLMKDHHWIVPDLRGFGDSAASEDASMEQYAADLAAVLDAAGVNEPVTLVGLSMGGYVLLEFWRRYPERVAGLVLANTRAAADSPAAVEGRYKTVEKVLQQGSSAIAEDMLPKLFAASASDDLKAEWHGIISHTDPKGVAAALRAMATRPDSTADLSAIQCPVLVITGSEDTLIPAADGETMYQAIPNAELVVIPNAAHMTPVEQPHLFAEAVRNFLQKNNL